MPHEIADFEVCSEFGMSWAEWKLRTPAYVQRVWLDLLAIKRRNAKQ